MREDIRLALASIVGNKLRSALTISIIAIGITSLLGIQVAVEILSDRVAGSFEKMGAGLYTIETQERMPELTWNQARLFALNCDFVEALTLFSVRDGIARIKSGGAVTDPVVAVIETDESYLRCLGAAVSQGRNFNVRDIECALPVALVGDNVRKKLFGNGSGIGCTVEACGRRYEVVGCIERQGALFGSGLDGSVLVPAVGNVGKCSITVMTRPGDDLMESVSMSKSLMNSIRRLPPASKTDYSIVRADSAQTTLDSVKSKLSLAALAIGLITILGAAVGLMNIMLVSVKERRREIGVRRAIGAKASSIERQFLIEAISIGQIGGAAGIIVGILSGNAVALIMDGTFTVPWDWAAISVVICLAVSLVSGVVPARRAASLDPIVALRDL